MQQPPAPREKISACITAGNEEKNIRRCLESVAWVDEIIVVDSFSTDRTTEISREYTQLVYEHRWLGYIGQKNLIKDLATGPWVLFVDADEEISPELKDEILSEFSRPTLSHYSAFEFPRMVWFLGRWIRHGDWYPDVKLRLFRKDRGQCGGKEPHDRMTVEGNVKRLKNPMHHFTYANLCDQLATLNKFSTITATTQFEDGRRFRYWDVFLRPFFRFLRCYLLKRGFMDGTPGFMIAVTAAFGVFTKYAKLWELYTQGGTDAAAAGAAEKEQT